MITHLLQAATTAAKAAAPAAASSGSTWTDIATAAGACVAAIAAIFALIFAAKAARAAGRQVTEAQKQVTAAQAQVTATQEQTLQTAKLEWQRTQAYVVAYVEPSPTVPEFADLVITNFGATPAYDIKLISDPPLARMSRPGDPGREQLMPNQPIPMLVPGQQWRTSWEMISVYQDAELPRRYEVTVSFTDEREPHRKTRAVLDWTSLIERRYVTKSNAPDGVVKLHGNEPTLAQLIELAWGGQEPEETYGGDALDEEGQPVGTEEATARRSRAAARGRSVLAAVRRRLLGGRW